MLDSWTLSKPEYSAQEVVFLRAPADAEVPSAELLKAGETIMQPESLAQSNPPIQPPEIVELPTFRSFDRAPVAMLEEVQGFAVLEED